MSDKPKTVWVTGASAGIGAEMARQWSRIGANLILTARRAEALETARQGCVNPDRHLVLPADLTDAKSRNSAIDAVKLAAGSGRLILVNNAGISQRSLASDTDMSVYRQLMELNYFVAVELTQALLPTLLANGGAVLSISSVAGRVGTPLRTGYCAAKHALSGYMDGLRAELADSGVSVTVAYPGFINTDIARNALTGSGSRQGHNDPGQAAGIDPAYCAAKIIRATEAGQDEVVVAGGKERVALVLRRAAPSLLRKVVSKSSVT